MDDILKQVWFGNTVQAYLFAGIYLAVGWFTVWIVKFVLLGRLKKWADRTVIALDNLIVQSVENTIVPLAYVSILLAAVKSLTLPIILSKTLAVVWAVVVMVVIVRMILGILQHIIFEVWVKRRDDRVMLERQMKSMMPFITFSIWGLGVVLLLDNLGFKITAIVAGLGIGGVAVALAAQAVLGDLFGYVAIMLDKPFELDDFIIVGDFMGTIEYIGIKTTRVRSLGGEQLIFSNKDLTDSRVRNYKRMQLRRIVFKLGVTYDTSLSNLKKAIEIVKEAIQKTSDTRFDRAHFANYGDFNLVIEAVYFVLSADYNKYMDVQQEINFRIKEAFEKERIDFAFPTQTVYLTGNGAEKSVGSRQASLS